MVDNCVECTKIGRVTECQYMEFPEGMHHYFDEKVCSFHHWFLYVRPRKGWENYLNFAKADGAAAGYHLTLPPDEVIAAAIRGESPPVVAPGVSEHPPEAASANQGQPHGSGTEEATPQPSPSQS
jgi:hypothetical protein